MLGLQEELGALAVGRVADIAVLDYSHGRYILKANSGDTATATEAFSRAFSLRAGKRFEVESPVVVEPVELAS